MKDQSQGTSRISTLLKFDAAAANSTNAVRVIGVDEVGLGALAGPVVAAALCFCCSEGGKLEDILVLLNDSKKLTTNQRKQLAIQIRENSIFCIGTVSIEELTVLQINIAAKTAMTRALIGVLNHVGHDGNIVLVDGPTELDDCDAPQKAIVKADGQSASVASASIVAKVYRDELMSNYAKTFPGYGWHHNAGYPTPDHKKSIRLLGLSPIHRANFDCLDRFLTE